MDSMMVEAHAKVMTRLEILYMTNVVALRYLLKNEFDETVTYRNKRGRHHRSVLNVAEAHDGNGNGVNVRRKSTSLTGKKADPVFAGFSTDEEGKKIISCPKGHTPTTCKYNANTGMITATVV